jgi:hypothetical protein
MVTEAMKVLMRRGVLVVVLAAGSGVVLQGCDDPKKGDKGADTGKGDVKKGDVKGGDTKVAAGPKFEDVTLDGKTYKLELALDDATRFHGLSDRTEIAADGGMLAAAVVRDAGLPGGHRHYLFGWRGAGGEQVQDEVGGATGGG